MPSNLRLSSFVAIALLTMGSCQAHDADEPPRLQSLLITLDSNAREVLKQVPADAASERFEALTANNDLISYVGLTEGPIGAVVFKNSQLVGTLPPTEARAYYACRGYATARNQYWAEQASSWSDSLMAAITPATEVTLKFSGKSSLQSIKSVITNPAITQVRAIVDIGTNPLNIFKTLSNARSNYREHERDQELSNLLSQVQPGTSEKLLAETLNPEDITFLETGIVMAYPKYSLDFLITQSKVSVIQQPSFHQLAASHAAIFYIEGFNWSHCTAQNWKLALTVGN